MVAFRQLNDDGDMQFGKGKNNYARDNAAVRLNIKTRIQSWLGDCFFAVDEGVDWWNRLGSKNQEQLLQEDLRTIILQTDEVTEILDLSINVSDRKFTASYTVNTTFSQGFTDLIERVL